MADDTLKQAASAVWDAIRRDRRARRKLVTQAELHESAALLRAHADTLTALAEQPAAPPAEAGAPAPAKKTRKPRAGGSKSKSKTKKPKKS